MSQERDLAVSDGTAREADESPRPRFRITMLIVLMVASFLCLFNETVLSVGNTAIMKEWGLDYNTVQWTMSGFLVAMSISVPIAAFVIHRSSTRTVFVCSLLLITVGLTLNAHSPSFAALITGRVIEGLGAGLLPTLLFSSALKLTKPRSQGFVTALCGVVIGLGPSFAPLYAGSMLSAGFNWRTLFVPLSIVSLVLMVLGYFLVSDVSERSQRRLDLLSVIESVIGFTSLVGGINVLAMSLTSALGWCLTALGIVVCVLWARRQLHLGALEADAKAAGEDEPSRKVPVLNLAVMKSAPIAAGMALIVLLQVANMGLAVVYPMAIEPGLGISAFVSSLMLMCPLLISQCFALFAGGLFDRFGAKATVLGGMTVLIIGFVLLGFSRVQMGVWGIGVFATLAFVGVAFVMPTVQARMFSLVEPQFIPDIVSGSQTSMQVGGALGTTITMGIFSAAFATRSTAESATAASAGTGAVSGQAYLSSFGVVSFTLAVLYALALVLAVIVVKGSKRPHNA
ncbi:MAG: MFS transporter [Bifidobacteriaceae bacterium]|jgi:DHA2 family lincomycin resistance protein-like MFS transporter|nr:MFS transporter [Bifidobacteriaceae bacterium]MCI1978821.1 MFS transporter [Bifidobacteriaceae bacterium]